jgi:hypothetical protein
VTKDANQKKDINKDAGKKQLTEEERRDDAIQSADKYDKFDSGNTKIDHLGEIGDMLDYDQDEKKENMKAQQEAMEAQKKKQMEMEARRMVAVQNQEHQLNRMSRIGHHAQRHHHKQMR